MANDIRIGGARIDLKLGIASLTTDARKATNTLKEIEKSFNQLSKTFKTFGKVVTFGAIGIGAVAAAQKIGQLANQLGQLAKAGEQASSVAEQFEKLGGLSSQIEKARASTLGLVDSFDLMSIANRGALANVQGFNENFSKIAELGARVADALGTDTKQSVDELSSAIIKGSEKGLKPFGFELEKGASKAKNQADALSQLNDVISRLAPLTDSAGNAFEGFERAQAEAYKQMGIGVNSSEELRLIWRQLESAIDSIDWRQVGQDIAAMASAIVGVLPSLKSVVEEIGNISRGIEIITGNMSQKTSLGLAAKNELDAIKRIESELSSRQGRKPVLNSGLGRLIDKGFGTELSGNSAAETARLQGELELHKKNLRIAEEGLRSLETVAVTATKEVDKVGTAIGSIGEESSKAAKEVQKLKEKWEQFSSSSDKKSLENQIKEAIETLNTTDFERLKVELQKTVKDGFLKEWSEAVEKGAVAFSEIEEAGEDAAYQVGKDLDRELNDAIEKNAETMRREFADAFDDVFSSLSGIGDALGLDLGGVFDTLGKFLSDGAKASIMESIGIGLGDIFGGGAFNATEIGAVFSALNTGVNSLVNAKGKDKATKSNAGTGGAIGTGAGIAIGASIGGPIGAAIGASVGEALGSAIGKMFKWGSQNPETKARHQFANWFEETLDKMGTIAFYDHQNNLKLQNAKSFNFLEGDSGKFNADAVTGNWAENFQKMGADTVNVFSAIGEAMEELLGISEDVGDQIGYLLAENLAGNLDNARLMVQQLGLSFEDMEKALLSAALSGEMSWHEFEVSMQGLTEAFKPGLAAVGDIKGAFDELIGSGGRGVAALKSIRDLAVETMEAGGKTLEDLKNGLITGGASEEQVNAIMNAIAARGITSLEALASASDRIAGGIVADIESASASIAEKWKDMITQIENVNKALNSLPEKVESTIVLNIQTNMDDATKAAIEGGATTNPVPGTSAAIKTEKFAAGGIVKAPTFFGAAGRFGVMGEAGAEAILPLKNINGKLGVSAAGLDKPKWRGEGEGMNINIDARGAAPGVERDIENTLRGLEDRILSRILDRVLGEQSRGGYRGVFR